MRQASDVVASVVFVRAGISLMVTRELQRGTVDAGHTPPLSGPGPDAVACMQVVAIKMRTVGSFRYEPAEQWVTTFLARFLTRDSAEGGSSDFGE